MRISIANQQAVIYACKHFHYSQCNPLNNIAYNVYNDKDEWCGVILYGSGASCNLHKTFNLLQGQIVELTRVALNGKQECTSKAIAMTLKQLKKEHPILRLVVSYADIDQHHLGIIYQATNWIYAGVSGKGTISSFIINGRKTHRRNVHHIWIIENGIKKRCPQKLEYVRRYIDPDAEEYRTMGKRKYLMPLDKNMRKQIETLAQPYPKNDGWVKIDREKVKTAKND